MKEVQYQSRTDGFLNFYNNLCNEYTKFLFKYNYKLHNASIIFAILYIIRFFLLVIVFIVMMCIFSIIMLYSSICDTAFNLIIINYNKLFSHSLKVDNNTNYLKLEKLSIKKEDNINSFNYHMDSKVTCWKRTKFEIQAESKEEADLKAIAFVQSREVDNIEWEDLTETIELLDVEANNNEPTEELYDSEKMIHVNASHYYSINDVFKLPPADTKLNLMLHNSYILDGHALYDNDVYTGKFKVSNTSVMDKSKIAFWAIANS